MTRNTRCILSKKNLLHNLSVIEHQAPGKKVMAMVKANAYGHGIVTVSQILDGKIHSFGVASLNEALVLKKAKITTPITLMEGIFQPKELEKSSENGFHIVFHDNQQLEWLNQTKMQNEIDVWIKINTGMGRLGFFTKTNEAELAIKKLSKDRRVKSIGIMSHFACAGNIKNSMNQEQITSFNKFVDQVEKIKDKELKEKLGMKSFCNSAAIFSFPEMHYDCVRPGLALYGGSPIQGKTSDELDLLPVMTFQTDIIDIREYSGNDHLGYCPQYKIPKKKMIVATAAVGYGDGFPFALKKKKVTTVLVGEKYVCPLIGEVMMDMIAIDITDCPKDSMKIGETTVTLWGKDFAIEKLADSSYCSSYSLMTNIHYSRVKFKWPRNG